MGGFFTPSQNPQRVKKQTWLLLFLEAKGIPEDKLEHFEIHFARGFADFNRFIG
jgi:hypothetical protein